MIVHKVSEQKKHYHLSFKRQFILCFQTPKKQLAVPWATVVIMAIRTELKCEITKTNAVTVGQNSKGNLQMRKNIV